MERISRVDCEGERNWRRRRIRDESRAKVNPQWEECARSWRSENASRLGGEDDCRVETLDLKRSLSETSKEEEWNGNLC